MLGIVSKWSDGPLTSHTQSTRFASTTSTTAAAAAATTRSQPLEVFVDEDFQEKEQEKEVTITAPTKPSKSYH